MDNAPKIRLMREGAEYLLQIEEFGRDGKYWRTTKRMYFPHLNAKPRIREESEDEY
jgi:hypothetical protein